MASRMERYTNNQDNRPASRLEKNKKVYEDLYTNVGYTQFTKLDSNVVDLSPSSSFDEQKGRREQYQRNREFSPFISATESSATTDNYRYQEENLDSEDNEKVYDINEILREAKKNREHPDELEKRRKLRTTEYNILAELNSEKIKEYKEKKKEVLTEEEEEQLEELIHTITSNTMRQDIDQQLLNDLMPTNMDETVIDENLSAELSDKIQKDMLSEEASFPKTDDSDEQKTEAITLDESFYTKSMDLSKEDLESDDSEEELFDDVVPKRSKVVKLFIVLAMLIVLAVILIIVYYYV